MGEKKISLPQNIQKILFSIARSRYSAWFLGIAFEHFSKLIPVDRIFENQSIIMFYHPDPFWEFHCVAVPKMGVPSFQKLDLSTETGKGILIDILENSQQLSLARDFQNYRVFVNGGIYQDVPQVHFHLASGLQLRGDVDNYKWDESVNSEIINHLPGAVLTIHPRPCRQIHYLMTPVGEVPPFGKINFSDADQADAVVDIFRLAQKTVTEMKLNAYSIITQQWASMPEQELVFHLVSGKRINCQNVAG
jgi:diadenosine tetraphosphate (Ap4A) HIT family hydrolase